MRIGSCCAALCFLVGCAELPESPAASRAPIVVGADGRQEVAQLPEPTRRLVLGSVVSLMAGHRLLLDGATSVRVNAPSLRDALGLCESEPFGEQPAAALCSGVLIDSDLVLTAGHCLGQYAEQAAQRCRGLRIAFSYSYQSVAGPLEISPEQVFFCRQVAVHVASAEGDFAILQLDRAVTEPMAAARLSPSGVELGDQLLVASSGAGLPIKVEREALVTDVRDTEFVAATDTFAGSSGGPLLNEELALVGIVKRGAIDWEVVDGCQRAVHTLQSSELHQPAKPALDALCHASWPNQTLCGTSDVCGDGICGTAEHGSCDADCPRPKCGDGLCELSEREHCEVDCHLYDAVPADWPLSPETFLERQKAEEANGLRATSGCTTPPAGLPASQPWATVWMWAALVLNARRRRSMRGRSLVRARG